MGKIFRWLSGSRRYEQIALTDLINNNLLYLGYRPAAFAGRKFIKEDVYRALRLDHSQTSTDAALFKPKMLAKISRIKAWYENPNGPYADTFAQMNIAEFKRYQERYLQREKDKISKGKGKKRAQREEYDSDRETSANLAKKAKKAKRINIDSDALDSD